jgi:hypothetical protein
MLFPKPAVTQGIVNVLGEMSLSHIKRKVEENGTE